MSHNKIAAFIAVLNEKPYIGRLSKTLYDKLVDHIKSECTTDHIVYRNIVSAIDNLENNRPMMKAPGELRGLLTGYQHAHFSAQTAVALFNNYALANGMPTGSFNTINDVSAFIKSNTKPKECQKKLDDFFIKYTERLRSGAATGDWLLYVEHEGRDANLVLVYSLPFG